MNKDEEIKNEMLFLLFAVIFAMVFNHSFQLTDNKVIKSLIFIVLTSASALRNANNK